MAMINFSLDQSFPIETDVILIPISSDWDLKMLSNSGTPVANFMKNSPQSVSFTYELKPKSNYNAYTADGYSNLKVRGKIQLPANDPNWMLVGSDWFPVANYTAVNSFQYKEVQIGISPPLTVSQGLHEASVIFSIEGEKSGVVEVLSSYTIPVKLNVFEEGTYYSPSAFTFYFGDSILVSSVLKVGGNNWTLNVPKGLTLTGGGVIINPDDSSTASGSGLTNFGLSLSSDIEEIIDDNQQVVLPVTVSYPGNAFVIPVTVIQAGYYYPKSLKFGIQNGQVDQAFQLIHLNRSDVYTVNAPNNIGFEMLNTDEGKKLKVYVIDPSSYGPGIFPLELKIIYSDATYVVDVVVTVGNQFDLGIDAFDTVFTRSMKNLLFESPNTGSYLELTLNFQGSESTFEYRMPFFKGSAQKNIGNSLSHFIISNKTSFIHAVVTPNVDEFTLESVTPLCYFDLKIQEIKEGNVLLSYNKKNIPFVLGYKPKVFDGLAILQHNVISRFTRNSFALVSVFSQSGSFSYDLLKNGEIIKSVNQIFGYIRTIKFDFEAYDADPGDVFEFALLTDEEPIKKSFVIVPDAVNSIDILYEDSFGLLSVINFTGNAKNINTEYDVLIELFHNQNFIHSRKHNEKEASTLILNTGYLLESQKLEVTELMKSPKAWIVKDDERVVELVPKNKKIEEMSSDNFLYSWSVEFDINKREYAQDYHI